MATGTLAVKVVKVDGVHAEDDLQKHISIKVTIGKQTKSTREFSSDTQLDQILNFDLHDVTGNEEFKIEAYESDKRKRMWKIHVADAIKSEDWLSKAFTEKGGHAKVHVQTKWTAKNTTQKIAGEGIAKTAEAAKSAAIGNPHYALAVTPTHRPWFMRASYYYDTTKNVYNYTTSFRVIAPVARFGESTANSILQKITGKTLADLDTAIVAPNLNSLDDTVDATISTVLTKLYEGQTYVLQKKNDAVSVASVVVGSTFDKVGKVKDYTTSSVKSVASSGLSTVASVTDYTTSSVKSVATTSYNTVASVTDYTTTQVSNVSSSAYGKVRGATVYVVSHVPYLGTKIRA